MRRRLHPAIGLLVLDAALSARVPPRQGGSGSSVGTSGDDELVSRVVTARISALPEGRAALALTSTEENETLAMNLTNLTDLMQVPQMVLMRSASWVRRNNPGLWLLLATAVVQSKRTDGSTGLREVRSQVELGDDYHIAIVTTAALPWMTGTAVNPLLRAAHLAKAGKRVTLMIPWIHPIEQARLFPEGMLFTAPDEQKAYIRSWLRKRGGMRAPFELVFYPGRYDVDRGSILPLGDITRFFSSQECDVAVLEEPEHLTWYHNGHNWRHRFKLVVGVVHTNYLFYAETWQNGGKLLAGALKVLNQVMCQAYCDKVIKLSDTLQPLPRAIVCNVHGVRADFLDIGRRASGRRLRRGAYFLGKALWAKGFRELLNYLHLQRERGDEPTHVDIYGKGEDLEAIKSEADAKSLELRFCGPSDHAGKAIRAYRVFVNPSQSEVLSTTTAEALAMGKWVVIQRHPSNAFFAPFRNALMYDSPEQFLDQLSYALSHTPAAISPSERQQLSWEGATARFLTALTTATPGDTLPSFADHTARWVHQGISAGVMGDAIRKVAGGGPVAHQSWLSDPQYRDAEVTEIVEQSIVQSPPPS